MSARIALLCPGQGAQHADMFSILGGAASDAHGLGDVLGMAPSKAVADPVVLFSNRHAQPLLVAATLAAWERVADAMPLPVVAAGYSIGELSAHAVAGAIEGHAALALAARRAALMDAAIDPGAPQALMAVTGLRMAALLPLLEAHGLFPAIVNGDDAAIVGGRRRDLAAVQSALASTHAHVTPLPVEVASHTPLLRPAADAFRDALDGIAFGQWRFPVLAGIDASPVASADAARAALARQLAETIRWVDCMDALAESGIAAAIELGPGAGLARMFAARHPEIACRSIADFRTLDGLLSWLERQL
ncbi:acyltransferase domain-containing protein [Noviherbaspirillum pedocola]|uniref:Acyltransferase domain-containing protein n=1 Tax=Noviherbaspirillum pedocola TaxID=2801341 RepID=A0A934W609_9BURK|nr:acyltransferase domain-containing protein [Noviherbaspirillum pedocola]MBK4735627.1 acyltransferase domain-containing protein [Noviherbaspirillum pedocola]